MLSVIGKFLARDRHGPGLVQTLIVTVLVTIVLEQRRKRAIDEPWN